jgi:hypothetical protein
MKLVALAIASLLALPVAARADEVLTPPGGPVYTEVNDPQDRPQAGAQPQQRQKNRAFKRALMDQFDANGDGRLGPQERMRAIRVLQRIQQKLAGGSQQQRGKKMQRFIQRFDTNHDGNVDRSEMPPGAARKLRRLDRDRDGWVEPNETR